MFKDNEILDALHRLSKQVEQIHDELQNAKVQRVLAQAREKELQTLQEKVIEKLDQAKRPPVPKNLGIYQAVENMTNLQRFTTTGFRAMTPQQAAGVPDELPEWMIPLYQHFIGLQGVDLTDLLNKAAAGPPQPGKRPCGWTIKTGAQIIPFEDLGLNVTGFAIPADVLKSGPAGSSSAQTPRRQCGCPVALPVHLAGCSQTSKNWQQRVGHCKCSPGPNESCPLHGIYLIELQVLIKREVAQVYEEMKNCKNCASTFCKSHAYGSVARVASDRVKNSPRGKELALILDTIGKPDCICPKDRPDLIAPDCPQHRGAK